MKPSTASLNSAVLVSDAQWPPRELDQRGIGDEARKLAAEIRWREDVVLGTDDERRQPNVGKVGDAVDGDDGVDAACDDLCRRKVRDHDALAFFQ